MEAEGQRTRRRRAHAANVQQASKVYGRGDRLNAADADCAGSVIASSRALAQRNIKVTNYPSRRSTQTTRKGLPRFFTHCGNSDTLPRRGFGERGPSSALEPLLARRAGSLLRAKRTVCRLAAQRIRPPPQTRRQCRPPRLGDASGQDATKKIVEQKQVLNRV